MKFRVSLVCLGVSPINRNELLVLINKNKLPYSNLKGKSIDVCKSLLAKYIDTNPNFVQPRLLSVYETDTTIDFIYGCIIDKDTQLKCGQWASNMTVLDKNDDDTYRLSTVLGKI